MLMALLAIVVVVVAEARAINGGGFNPVEEIKLNFIENSRK